MKVIRFLTVVILILLSQCSTEKKSADALRSLLDAEVSFARLSEEKGIREAFITYLSDSAIVFLPRPELGKPNYENYSFTNTQLFWKPGFVEVSGAGDFGYTTGPSIFKRTTWDSTREWFGHFVSVWQRQSDGQWKVKIDAGIFHPKPDQEEQFEVPADNASSTSSKVHFGKADLMQLENEFSSVAESSDWATAIHRYGDTRIRLFMEGHFPLIGKEAIASNAHLLAERKTFHPIDAIAAESGDLGCAYGIATADPGGKDRQFSYLHVWKRFNDGAWRLMVNIENEIPAE
ncbi:MAG: DUF4440 domain-containing protein [Candidatus Zhuqueibacterota bacterium]